MTGSTAGLIIISIVVVIILAASIYLVFYYDTGPAGQREASTERPVPGRAARQAGGRPEGSPDLQQGETEASPAAERDTEAPAERAAGTAAGRVTAA
jgi:hypothetical protein